MSETMIARMRLRFVERWVPDPKNSMLEMKVRILQQLFQNADSGEQVWRDVPLEPEGA
jgi:hypothetical protein